MRRLAAPLLALAVASSLLLGYRSARTFDPGPWLHNGHFDDSIAAWNPAGSWDGVSFGWSPEDRDGSRASGSARITIQAGFSHNPYAVQCRPIPLGATTVTLSGAIRYPVDSGASNAWMQGASFTGPGCTGTFVGAVGRGAFEPQPGWTDITSTAAIPAGAHSISVQFGLLADFNAPTLTANFDKLTLVFDHVPAHHVVAPNLARD